MSDKHVCQLRNDEKADLLRELRSAVARMEALQPKPEPKYSPEELPNFLRERVPRFKKNLDLQPLITHTAADEIRFTGSVKVANSPSDDPQVKFLLIPGASNPFASTTSDTLCQDFCNKAVAAEMVRKGQASRPAYEPKPVCLTQQQGDAPKDPQGNSYDCEHNRKYEGIAICNPHGHDQSYLCTQHVYPPTKR